MIQTKQFNKVPAAMIPKLRRDEVAVFVCLHNSVGPGGVPLYPTYSIAPVATIMTDDGPVEIANVVEDAPEGKRPKLGDAMFESSQKGTIICKGSSPSDIRLFEFLSLHPENEANGGSTFRREEPGARQKSALDKARTDMVAINFALETPIDTLKSLLTERGLKFDGKTDDEIRIMATDEGKRKLFEAKELLIGKAQLPDIQEMFEVQVIVWDQSAKKLKNVNSGLHYDAKVSQTDKPVDKMRKLVEAANTEPALAEQLLADVHAYNNPS